MVRGFAGGCRAALLAGLARPAVDSAPLLAVGGLRARGVSDDSVRELGNEGVRIEELLDARFDERHRQDVVNARALARVLAQQLLSQLASVSTEIVWNGGWSVIAYPHDEGRHSVGSERWLERA